MTDRYAKYDKLLIERPEDGILKITFNNPESYNSVDAETHRQITYIWRDIDEDPSVRTVVVTGAGKAFSAGGDFSLVEKMTQDPVQRMMSWKEAKDLVYNMLNCSKVIISAINGPAVGAGLVVALMADRASQPVTTCSIGFDVADLDETAHARLIAEKFGSAHHERIVDPAMFDRIDALAAMFDEPFADASALPTAAVCALAREHVTVALSGDGADEAFAGYRRHVFHAAEERARGALPLPLRRAVFGPLATLYPKADWAPRPLRAKTTFQSLALSGE